MKRTMRHTADGQPALELISQSDDENRAIDEWKDVHKAKVHIGEKEGRLKLFIIADRDEPEKTPPKKNPDGPKQK